MELFPTALFNFPDSTPHLVRRIVKGPPSLSGLEQALNSAAAGRWFFDLSNAALIRDDQVLEWRALEALIGDNVTPFWYPICDRRHQPLLARVDDTPQVSAAFTADAALNATSVSVTLTAPKPIVRGMHFSVQHATQDWRLYRIANIISGEGSSGAFTFNIRPWLREAVTADMALDFDNPRFLARITGDMALPVNLGRFGKAAVGVVEHFVQPDE